jgi:hypothetical protein
LILPAGGLSTVIIGSLKNASTHFLLLILLLLLLIIMLLMEQVAESRSMDLFIMIRVEEK